jgi:hypothetical protein
LAIGSLIAHSSFAVSNSAQHSQLIDAVRLSDGTTVGLKKVSKSRHPFEVEICDFFSSDPISKDPKNRCIPLLQTLDVPDDADLVIIVMPLLREYDDPRFDTYGEAIDCIKQLFEVRFDNLCIQKQNKTRGRDCNLCISTTSLIGVLVIVSLPTS